MMNTLAIFLTHPIAAQTACNPRVLTDVDLLPPCWTEGQRREKPNHKRSTPLPPICLCLWTCQATVLHPEKREHWRARPQNAVTLKQATRRISSTFQSTPKAQSTVLLRRGWHVLAPI